MRDDCFPQFRQKQHQLGDYLAACPDVHILQERRHSRLYRKIPKVTLYLQIFPSNIYETGAGVLWIYLYIRQDEKHLLVTTRYLLLPVLSASRTEKLR